MHLDLSRVYNQFVFLLLLYSKDGFQDWTFATVRCWGEEPTGLWKLTVSDRGKQ